MNQLATIHEDKPLSAAQVKAGVQLIQEVMRDVMLNGVHYGTVPGCGDKPALLKPGAEKIMATFRLSADPEVDDLSSNDNVRYRVRVRMVSAAGVVVGVGIGECSSDEDKYKWRRSVCDEEFEETPADRRREKWARGKGGSSYKTKQVRTSFADVANTVLKMAKKRALVDGVLTATAASDCFEQDIEEMPPELLDDREQAEPARPTVQRPRSKSQPSAAPAPSGPAVGLTESMRKMVTVKAQAAGVTDSELAEHFGVKTLEEIPASKVNEVLDFVKQFGADANDSAA